MSNLPILCVFPALSGRPQWLQASAFDYGLCGFLTFIKTVWMWAQTLTNITSDKGKVLQQVSAAADWVSKTQKLKREPREEKRSHWVHISPTSENYNGIRQRIDWSFCACLSVTWNIISSENSGNMFPWWFGPVKQYCRTCNTQLQLLGPTSEPSTVQMSQVVFKTNLKHQI